MGHKRSSLRTPQEKRAEKFDFDTTAIKYGVWIEAIIIYFPHHASFLSYSVLFNAEILIFFHDLRLPKYMVDWGVGVILAHYSDTNNYKKKLVIGYVQNNTLWPKYPTNNSIL